LGIQLANLNPEGSSRSIPTLLAIDLFSFNILIVESALEAMRTWGFSEEFRMSRCDARKR
jgi:hypothetical protein